MQTCWFTIHVEEELPEPQYLFIQVTRDKRKKMWFSLHAESIGDDHTGVSKPEVEGGKHGSF